MFFNKSAFVKFFSFFKIMLESCGCSLYTSAADTQVLLIHKCSWYTSAAYTQVFTLLFLVYSLVEKDGTKVEDIEGDDPKE